MKAVASELADVLILEPHVHEDERGHFFESFNQKAFEACIGRRVDFVQDNQSRSLRNVIRGLHYQIVNPQDKLVRAVSGEVFDVAVDLRRNSPSFGRWAGVVLSAENRKQLWIPKGFAHGFLVLSESAALVYKVSDYYAPAHERCLLWNDRALGIQWPVAGEPILSAKDRAGVPLAGAEVFA